MIWDDGSYVILGEESRSFNREGWDLIPSDRVLDRLNEKWERRKASHREYKRKKRLGSQS